MSLRSGVGAVATLYAAARSASMGRGRPWAGAAHELDKAGPTVVEAGQWSLPPSEQEALPSFAGAGGMLLLARAWLAYHLRRRR